MTAPTPALEQPYLDLMQTVLEHGVDRHDRTGVGTRSVFGHQMRFDLSRGFPLLTTKKLHLRSIIHELLWFLKGDTNIAYLKENGVRIWDEWADENGDLGPVYGYQWRSWPDPKGGSVDQISKVLGQIRTTPQSRRLIVSAWNPAQVDEMQLPPCHCLFQFYVANGKLSCQLYQRSADIFLGVPFNIASYALLLTMVAQVTGLQPGEFIHTLGDAHLYSNHLEQAKEQLARNPKATPKLVLNPAIDDLFAFRFEDIESDMVKHKDSFDSLVPVAMIVAMAKNRVIGVDGKLPWYLPEDLKFFKRITQAKPLVMGRKTYASIGKPLPNRLNVVVTRNAEFSHEGVRVCHDLTSALELADQHATIEEAEEIMVMGGGEIYRQALPFAQRLYITEVDIDVEGDATFPDFDPSEWQEVQRVAGQPAEGQPNYDFVVYERIAD